MTTPINSILRLIEGEGLEAEVHEALSERLKAQNEAARKELFAQAKAALRAARWRAHVEHDGFSTISYEVKLVADEVPGLPERFPYEAAYPFKVGHLRKGKVELSHVGGDDGIEVLVKDAEAFGFEHPIDWSEMHAFIAGLLQVFNKQRA